MKIKEYFNSLVTRRKNTPSKSKSHSSTDCHYELCGYEDANKLVSRTEVLLNRHAQLINTIVGIRSQQDSGLSHQSNFHNRNYDSSTLATSNPRRECQHQTLSGNNSLSTTTRQRSKIRTNPWINTNRTLQLEYSIYDPTLSSGLIHSESFPQTISNGNILLHQSDSGHGFSLSSSRMIDSSSPDNTSSDGPILDEKQYRSSTTNPSDNKRRGIKRVQSRYQHPRIITSPKKQNYHPPRVHNDHFSLEFEDIVENERLNKPPTRKSPFILPLDETDIKSSLSATLKKTNSHTILKHIEEIENEIRMIKNLNFDSEEQMLSANKNEQQSIHEQVNQWVEECLTTTKHIPNVRCIYSDKNHQTSSLPKPSKRTELMTAFYLSSIPTTKRILSSFNCQSIAKNSKSIHECPF